jgi:tight adherence protein C
MNTQMIPLVAAVMVFVAIMIIGILIWQWQLGAAKRRSLALVTSYASADVHQAVVEVEKQESIVHAAMVGIGNRLVGRKSRDKLTQSALYAGETSPDAVEAVVTRKIVFMTVGGLLGLLLGLNSGGIMWLTFPGFMVAGFLVPNLLLYNRGLKRDEDIALHLPDALDMLNLCVESGLSFQAALGQVASNQTGPVAEEFALVLQEMQYGRSRGQSLSALSGRTRQADVHRFVNAMLQVDKLGVPVATVLREQAKEMRAKRYSRAREQAQKVPVKILMPLMLCFLPALFVIILGPAAYSIAKVFSGT